MRASSALVKSAFGAVRRPQRSLSATATKVAASGVEVISPLIGLTDDQKEFYSLAKNFADNEMKPFAAKWDETSEFPMETFKKTAELGFAGLFVKDDVGGSGLSRVDATVIIEALATGCVGTTAMLTIHNMCAGMIGKLKLRFSSSPYSSVFLRR
jgi:isobutyryl-CoA dehydrogenase